MNKYLIIGIVILFVFLCVILFTCYKKCPKNHILVITNQTDSSIVSCINGGGAFVWPFIQDYGYLSLRPAEIQLGPAIYECKNDKNAELSLVITIGISTETHLTRKAAEKFLSKHCDDGKHYDVMANEAYQIFLKTSRDFTATLELDDILSDLSKYRENMRAKIEDKLNTIGFTVLGLEIQNLKKTEEKFYN